MRMTILWSVLLAVLLLATAAIADENHEHGDGASEGMHQTEQLQIGKVGHDEEAQRTIMVEMSDPFKFEPAAIQVGAGETVRLIVRNSGAILHEWILGTLPDVEEHAELMRRFPNMEHDEPQQVRVPPGEVRELVWNFNRSGTFTFACLQPGHFEAGMRGIVEVK